MGRPKKKEDTEATAEEAIQIQHDEQDNEEAPGPAKGERFTCNAMPSLSFLVGNDKYQFSEGAFVTNDPEVVKAVRGLQYFGVHIFADNQDLNPEVPE